MYRYTPDQRFSSLHKPSSENWVLEIRNTAIEDQGCSLIYISPFDYYFIPSGIYECQISTTPVRSLRFNLEVVGNKDFNQQAKIVLGIKYLKHYLIVTMPRAINTN